MSMYSPLIKWKSGERGALRRLDTGVKDLIVPIFEFQPGADLTDQESVALHRPVLDFCKDATNCWGLNRPFYIDANHFDVPATSAISNHPILELLNNIQIANLIAIPVLWSDSSPDMIKAIRDFLETSSSSHVALRLFENDSINAGIIVDNLADELEISRNQIDVILDYQYLDSSRSLASAQVLIQGWISNLGTGLGQVILLGGSMPPNLWEHIDQDSTGILPRQEWRLWTRIRTYPGLSHLVFGDYTTINPMPLGDTGDMRPSAKIKYTLSNDWLIARGQRIWKVGGAQHHKLAEMIVGHHGFRNPASNYGEKYIDDCSRKVCGPGNSETWVTVGVNQHISFVVSQLLASPAVSLGTPSHTI